MTEGTAPEGFVRPLDGTTTMHAAPESGQRCLGDKHLKTRQPQPIAHGARMLPKRGCLREKRGLASAVLMF
jgi:hypothetical protein